MKLAPLFLLALLLSAPAAARGHERLIASLDAAPGAAEIQMFAWPGGLGIPKVITWADTTGASGIAWGTTSAITAANASVTYNATNLVQNVPTGKGFQWTVNGAQQMLLSNAGALTVASCTGCGGTAPLVLTGTSDVTQLKVIANATQTTVPFQIFQSDGTTNSISVSNAGAVAVAGSYGFSGTGSQPAAGGLYKAASTVVAVAGPSGGNVQTVIVGLGSPSLASGIAANQTTLSGQFSIAHLTNGSGTPTSPTAGAGCGTSSAPTVTGGSISGQIGVVCGTAGTNGNNFVSATFPVAFNSVPFCLISCANAATCAGEVLSDHMANPTASTIAVQCAGGTCTTGTLLWNWVCVQ